MLGRREIANGRLQCRPQHLQSPSPQPGVTEMETIIPRDLHSNKIPQLPQALPPPQQHRRLQQQQQLKSRQQQRGEALPHLARVALSMVNSVQKRTNTMPIPATVKNTSGKNILNLLRFFGYCCFNI